jgi:uncharacterized membrane protein YesL
MSLFGGLFNYSKPGPGVDKNGPEKKRFFYFFELFGRKFWKLIELNLLYLLCCIPIVTIGPATCGLVYILRNFANEKPVFMVSDFFDAFKSNFKQGFALGILDILTSGIVAIALLWYIANQGLSWAMAIPLGLSIVVLVLLMFMRFYTYLCTVTVELPLKHIIKNSFIFAFLGFKHNFCTLFWWAVLIVPLLWYLPLIWALVFVLIGFALIWFIAVFNSYPYIVKYIIEPHDKQMREQLGEDDDEEYEEDEEDDVIFTDIGSQEKAVAPEKKAGKQKIIR